MKTRKLNGCFEVVSDLTSDMQLSPHNHSYNGAKRAVAEKGWKCPYCGEKFKNYSYFTEFTLHDHLKLSQLCRKDHERTPNP